MNAKHLLLLIAFFAPSLYAAEKLSIRKYKSTDKESVSKLLLTSEYVIADHENPEKDINDFLEGVPKQCWWTRNHPLVCVNNQNVVVGFVNLLIMRIKFGSLEFQDSNVIVDRLIVSDQYRRQGVAQKLLQRAVAYAYYKQKKSVALNVTNTNGNAIALYEKLGFLRKYAVSDQLIYELTT